MVKSHNPNIKKVNFSSRTSKEMSKINSGKSKAKSDAAKLRWMKEKSPEITLLMDFYKSGNANEVMSKYLQDNEKFMQLYDEAETGEDKRKALQNYQTFNLKIFELLVGTKSFNVNVNVNKPESAKSIHKVYQIIKQEEKEEDDESDEEDEDGDA